MSAIDAAVALANHHGEFVENDNKELQYRENPETEGFAITMFSRKGILPEADFYHPIPYEPLLICNAKAIQQLIESTSMEDLLDAAFELFRQELVLADPVYAAALGLQAQTLEDFCSAYFSKRALADPFVWARCNLEEAVLNAARKFTVRWRYAIYWLIRSGFKAPRATASIAMV